MKLVSSIAEDPYRFDTDQNGVPIFTNKNIALIHALLEYDSAYSAAFDRDDTSSYAGWLARNGVPTSYEDIARVVNQIDAANSTHLASQGRRGGGGGRELTAEGISQIKDLKERLRKSDDSLVEEIAAAGGKNNFSFASKFCAYICLFACDIQMDNYCIYDKVVSQILPYYAYMYAKEEVGKPYYRPTRGKIATSVERLTKERHDYARYRCLVDAVIEGVNSQRVDSPISYTDFDQLVWYYFKRDDRLISNALRSIE